MQEAGEGELPAEIALLRLDTDNYASTKWELEELYPRLCPGGVLIVDDYGKQSGSTEACREYFSSLGDAPLLTRLDVQGAIAVKS